MSTGHVIVNSQDESIASIVTEFLTFDGLSASAHTTQFDLFNIIRTIQPVAVVLVQPGCNRSWFYRLVETIYWDPTINSQVVVATHEPERFRLWISEQSGQVAAILSLPFDFNDLCQTIRTFVADTHRSVPRDINNHASSSITQPLSLDD